MAMFSGPEGKITFQFLRKDDPNLHTQYNYIGTPRQTCKLYIFLEKYSKFKYFCPVVFITKKNRIDYYRNVEKRNLVVLEN
jgi:hypothetical protein